MKKLLLSISIVLSSLIIAQEDSSKAHFSIATDISPWAMNGNSIKVAFQPKTTVPIEFSMEYFSMEYPSFFINLQKANEANDWRARANSGIAFYTDFKLNKELNGWTLGMAIVRLTEQVSLDDFNTLAQYNQIEFLGRVHYTWFPGKQTKFFVNPYFAFGFRGDPNKTAVINGAEYTPTKFLGLGSVYLGVRL